MLTKADNATICDDRSTADQLVVIKPLFKPVDITLELMLAERKSVIRNKILGDGRLECSIADVTIMDKETKIEDVVESIRVKAHEEAQLIFKHEFCKVGLLTSEARDVNDHVKKSFTKIPKVNIILSASTMNLTQFKMRNIMMLGTIMQKIKLLERL